MDQIGTPLSLKKSLISGYLLRLMFNFLIEGPEGLNSECFKLYLEVWSPYSLTLPHTIVPVIIIEQLYRVWLISKSNPYHW